MNLLFGILGNEAKHYKYLLQDIPEVARLEMENGFIVNMDDNPLHCKPKIQIGNKVLFIHGVFFLRNYSVNDIIANEANCLETLLKMESLRIPNEFVNGAFNAVIVENSDICIFNDFMALDPLYYSRSNGTFYFANDLRFLNRILHAQWNDEAISECLALGNIFSGQTILKGIRYLTPAAVLTYKNGKVILRQYASYPKDPEIQSSQKEIVASIHEALTQAINRIYSPKLKYSMSLTGGMDSRLIYFAWPDRKSLLTETAGRDTSDFLKARALVDRLGDPAMHALEDMKDELHLDGKRKFYELCDNPSMLLAEFNYYHLLWKMDRGADFRLTGVGGEHLNGENLYLSRKPFYVMREAFFPYKYHPLEVDIKKTLIASVLYSGYKQPLGNLLDNSVRKSDPIYHANKVVETLDEYLGNPSFPHTYIERFRTLLQANAAFYPLHVVERNRDILIMPLNDRELLYHISIYHPKSRELRRLELSLLKKYNLAPDIPFDTSHILQSRPYFMHKFMRAMRMVLNIGLHKKIPIIQKGDPPKQRAYKYFDPEAKDFRAFVNEVILGCSYFNHQQVKKYLDDIGKVDNFNFYTHHREASNIRLLLRLAYTERNLKSS